MFLHVSAHSPLSPGNQETDAVSNVWAICLQVPLEAEHWVHVKIGYRGANTGCKISKAFGLPIKCYDNFHVVQSCWACPLLTPQQKDAMTKHDCESNCSVRAVRIYRTWVCH